MKPFLTLYTPTYRRPKALAACMASVAKQTDLERIEHLIVADYVGIGIAGVYASIPKYASAIHGAYVHVLADDDELSNPSVVAQVRDFAEAAGTPPIILVGVVKDGHRIPGVWPPVCGAIDLGNLIVRRDLWVRHATDWGACYEGDYWFAHALELAGHAAVHLPLFFLHGGVRRGAPEVAA